MVLLSCFLYLDSENRGQSWIVSLQTIIFQKVGVSNNHVEHLIERNFTCCWRCCMPALLHWSEIWVGQPRTRFPLSLHSSGILAIFGAVTFPRRMVEEDGRKSKRSRYTQNTPGNFNSNEIEDVCLKADESTKNKKFWTVMYICTQLQV